MLRPAFSILVSPDSGLLRQKTDALLSAPAQNTGTAAKTPDWQRFTFWGEDGLTPSFWEHLTLQGLFAVPKALIVRNVQSLPIDTIRGKLFPALAALAGSEKKALRSPLIWPFVCLEVGFDKGKAKVPQNIAKLDAFQLAEQRKWIEYIPPLEGKALDMFIATEASRLGITLDARQRAVLSVSLPPDAVTISGEMRKLALLADADGSLPPDFAESIAHAEELSIFEMMRIVQQGGKSQDAWRHILHDRISGESSVFAFIAILLREARILWQSLYGPAPRLPGNVAAQKKVTARAMGPAGIAKLWDAALTAEKGIKSGQRSPEQAFEALAADLFRLFSAR